MRKSLFASGTVIALAFAGVILAGLFIVGVYKSRESGLPPVSASFRLQDGAPANATVHTLDFRAVHSRDSFLEDHLDTALQLGLSEETNRLRVAQMHDTLRELTASDDPLLFVRWQGAIVQVGFSGF